MSKTEMLVTLNKIMEVSASSSLLLFIDLYDQATAGSGSSSVSQAIGLRLLWLYVR